MTELSFANKLYAHLAEGITSGQTTIPIVSGQMGNIWSGFRTGTYLYLVIMNELGQKEIVKVTGVINDTLTVERGQGGTSAKAFAIGSPVSQRFVAEQMNYFLQRGVFPFGAYNPNTVLTGTFNGEKFWQTGPAADQKRWWINAGGGDKWRLMTGDIYGNEYRDAEGFIIAPPGWVRVAAYTDGNGPDALCEYDGEIFTSESDEGNLLRFDVDTLTEVAPYIFPVEGVKTFMEYSVDGKLHAAMPRRRIYQWNGVDAWVELYNGGAGSGYVGMVELSTKIYISTGGDGQLIEYDASPTIVAPKYGNDGITDLVLFGGEIYAVTYYTAGGTGGRLFKWNGINAWTVMAGKYSDSRNTYAVCVHDGEIYASAYYTSNHLLKWNGVDAWELIATTTGMIVDFYSDGFDLYCLVNGDPNQTILKWDGVTLTELDIVPPEDPESHYLRRFLMKDLTTFYATSGFGLYSCLVP